MPKSSHQPVLYKEVLIALQIKQGGRYIDGTLGAGGHAKGILEGCAPDGMLLGLEIDPQAFELANRNLTQFGQRAILRQASYTTLNEQLKVLGWQQAVDGILLDLGVSSMQLDTAERGFSFQVDAPLDMRFDPNNPVSADELVNDLTERELADVLFRFGEEPRARQIAHAIVNARPLHSTKELSELVEKIVEQSGGQHPYRMKMTGKPGKKSYTRKVTLHPATLTFQALRIAVNRELEAIEMVLPDAVAALKPGGRLAIIAFHSLEDRLVKQFFRQESRDCICSRTAPKQPVCTCGHKATVVEIYRRPLRANAAEVSRNSRARSARLRVVEKI